MWFKFFYFLRTIEQTSYLIKMIINVVADMRVFIFLLFCCIIAFADAFMSANYAMPEEDRFIEDYPKALEFIFLLTLGEFNEMFGAFDYLGWILFILCTVFNLIVMLNLLIAVISTTFEDAAEIKQ